MAHVMDIAPRSSCRQATRAPSTGRPTCCRCAAPRCCRCCRGQGQAGAWQRTRRSAGSSAGARRCARATGRSCRPTSPGARATGSSSTSPRTAASRNLAAANPQKLGEMLVAWRDYVRETGTLEIPNLANRPGYSNGAKYYEDPEVRGHPRPAARPNPERACACPPCSPAS